MTGWRLRMSTGDVTEQLFGPRTMTPWSSPRMRSQARRMPSEACRNGTDLRFAGAMTDLRNHPRARMVPRCSRHWAKVVGEAANGSR